MPTRNSPPATRTTSLMAQQQKKLLSKIEWILLVLALGILTVVILQNFGINMIETTESIEISEEERRAREVGETPKEVNTLKGQ